MPLAESNGMIVRTQGLYGPLSSPPPPHIKTDKNKKRINKPRKSINKYIGKIPCSIQLRDHPFFVEVLISQLSIPENKGIQQTKHKFNLFATDRIPSTHSLFKHNM